ncbi:MAG: hypothetical protein OXE99_06790 [Cellvibrionales bacterium]|nr:hypothetical protein [Cellvibrionales bacterium]
MAESLLELIELENGDVALKAVDTDRQDEDPIVILKFSEQSLDLMQEAKMVIAQAMIEAGMLAYSELIQDRLATAAEENATIH